MFQVRLHGRGGQGAVTTAELLSVAAFGEGRHAQAFPSFGSERMGAPVMAFCRIDDKPIRTREPVTSPDALIISDPTLLHQVQVFAGLRPSSFMLINTPGLFGDLGLGEYARSLRADRLLVVPASRMAQEHLGRPLPGAALLGGFAALTGQVGVGSVIAAIRERFTGKAADGNAAAAREAFDFVMTERKALADA
jgi:pyruvate ferredoxin oxidoreductase gamma subunit